MPPQGEDLMEYLERKFGPTATSGFASPNNPLDVAGRKVGILFNRNRRVIPTLHAHVLVEWLKQTVSPNQVDSFMTILFDKYFCQGWNIAMEDLLLSCVQEAGLDVDEAKKVLVNPDAARSVLEKDNLNKARGVHGVPFFIIGKHSFSGGHPPPIMEEILQNMLDES